MDCRTTDLCVHHQLLEFTQTHAHWVGDAIQPSHPLLSPSPPFFSLSQHQGSFQISQFFVSGDQSIGVSPSASVLPMNIQDQFPLGWTGWILQYKGLSRDFSNTTMAQRLKHLPAMWETWVRSLGWEDPLEKEMATHSRILAWWIPWTEEPGGLQSVGSQRVGHDWATSLHFTSAFFIVQLSQLCITTGKTIAWARWNFVGKVTSLFFNMLSRLVIAFLPRSKHLLIHGYSHHLQWFWSPGK